MLKRIMEEGNTLHTVKRKKANLICDILRRNCLLKYIIEGKIEGSLEVTGRRLRRHKQLMGNLKEKESVLEIQRGSANFYSVEEWFWKNFWICRKTDYRINDYILGRDQNSVRGVATLQLLNISWFESR